MEKTDSRNQWLNTKDRDHAMQAISQAIDILKKSHTRLSMVRHVENMSPQEIEQCKALMKKIDLMDERDDAYEAIFESEVRPPLEGENDMDIFQTVFNERYPFKSRRPFKSSHPALKAVEDG